MINAITMILVLFGLPRIDLHKFSKLLQEKNRLVNCTLIVSGGLACWFILKIRYTDEVFLDWCIVIAVSVILICYLCYQWQLARYKANLSVRMFQTYRVNNEAYRELIEEIRAKQHDYKNMLNTIYYLHYNCHTYEELVEAQKEYCDKLLVYTKQEIVDVGEPALSALIYSKIQVAKKKGIVLECFGKVAGGESSLIVMNQIEILGNLLDNAIEALENRGNGNRIIIRMFSDSKDKGFEVRNTLPADSEIDLTKLVQKGYSTKGKSRGYGLSNVSEICKENDWKFMVTTDELEQEHWIVFKVNME